MKTRLKRITEKVLKKLSQSQQPYALSGVRVSTGVKAGEITPIPNSKGFELLIPSELEIMRWLTVWHTVSANFKESDQMKQATQYVIKKVAQNRRKQPPSAYMWKLAYAQQFGLTVLPAFLSLAGFTKEAQTFCGSNGIAVAETIAYAYQSPAVKPETKA